MLKRTASIYFIPVLLFCFASFSPREGSDLYAPAKAADTTGHFIDSLLRTRPDLFGSILKNINKYEVQIIYTKIDRDKKNEPTLTHYTYRLGRDYFYPASLVKLPTSLLALEKLNELDIKGLDRNSVMYTDSSKTCPFAVRRDTTSETNLPSVAGYIKRMMLVSDNFAFNRMYEFVSKEELNAKLERKGYGNCRIIHSFDGSCSNGSLTNAVTFIDANGDTLYHQPEQANGRKYVHPMGIVKKGKAYYDNNNKLIKGPKDFTGMNYLPLQDVHEMVISVMFPRLLPKEKRFDISEDDRKFLRTYMGMLPRESDHPGYDRKKFEDSHKKYLIFGTSHDPINTDSIRIYNIVGQSYGNLIDCAYIADFKNNTEFFLSAAIYVNSDGVLNDGKYDYKTIGFPFLANLGKVVREYEQGRVREHVPELGEFR